MKKKQIPVSIFKSYKSTNPMGTIDLWDWLLKDFGLYADVDLIRSTSDKKLIKEMKSNLPAITPSGIFTRRKASEIESYTGIACIDIDEKDNPSISVEELKEQISQIQYIMYCGLSVSGNGVFCMIKIAHPEQHKSQIKSIEKDFKEVGIKIDNKCSDLSRLRGYSYDKNPYINEESLIYDALFEESDPVFIKEEQQKIVEVKSLESCFFTSSIGKGYIQVLAPIFKNKADDIKLLVTKVVNSKIDITDDYGDWIAICAIIANTFGENGRILFHDMSKFYPKYTFEESNSKYTEFLNCKYNYSNSRIFDIARRFGIEI